MSSDIFSSDGNHSQNTPQDETPSFVDQLVGEGKKFSTIEELAKGKMESDRYIEELKANERNVDDKLSQLINQLSEQANKNNTPAAQQTPVTENTNTDTSTVTQSQMDAESVESLVQNLLKQNQDESRQQSNLNKVEDFLNKTFGEKAKEVVSNRAKELNISVERMAEIAKESPEAFSQLVITSKQENTNALSGSVNSAALGLQTGNKLADNEGWSYYKKMKKENPKQFYSSFDTMQALIDKHGSDVFYAN